MPHEIVYPAGCRPITEDLGADELIRRLKTLAHTLQAMGQDEGMYQQYIPLAIHLADEHFLSHQSRDVQLLIACCIADVLRVYAPEAPYKDTEKVKMIFMFLIQQLAGLKDPKDPAFKRYFYLLENLAYVKSFNMCFDLEDCQEIFCNLFSLMFKIVNDEHSIKVKSFMLDVLCPLITESDIVSNELLDIILINVVEPNKSSKKNAYVLAKELIVKCSDTLEPYIQAFFNHVLIIGRVEKSLSISTKVFDLIYELNKICPSVLVATLPQLEVKLKSSSEDERLGAVSLLAKMFSEKDSYLAKANGMLWRAFLGRFNDINVFIRIKCVQYSMHFLLNHPELRQDIIDTLKMRQHDTEESVRYEVVMAIVSTAKKNCEIVSGSEDLLELVKERTLDKKFKIRKEAMNGLALIYRKYLLDADVPQATKKAVTWIKDKILHGYYVSNMDDRLVVERLLNNSLVPYQLPTEERMKKLYHLLGTIDDNATRAFLELQKHQLVVRRAVAEWVDLYTLPPCPDREKKINQKVGQISKYLPEQVKGQEFLQKLAKHMTQDTSLLVGMQNVVRPDISCKECAEITGLILKKLGQPVMTNLYYNTIKILLERVSSVMIDQHGIKVLVGYVEDCLRGGNLIEEIGLHPNTAGERGLKLLVMLSFVFPCHFLHADIISHLISLLDIDPENVSPLILLVIIFLGKYKPISEIFPEEYAQLTRICMNYIASGTPKQAKQAIRCLYRHTADTDDNLFTEILEKVKENLNPESEHYLTAIVALGHVAYNLPTKFPVHMKNLVSRKIVKELLVKSPEGEKKPPEAEVKWIPENELPFETRSKVEGCKTMARWLLGLKADRMAAQKTFRMLTAFIQNKGDLLQSGKITAVEMAWLRLAAGKAMLKICEQKGVGDQFTAEQFYTLSTLVTDEVPEVREIFLAKLHKGLNRGLPSKCLPLDFMGYYALTAFEEDKKLKTIAKKYYQNDVQKRTEYAKTLTQGSICSVERAMNELPRILPDYTLVFALPVLAHCSRFTDWTDISQLLLMKNSITYLLEPLMARANEFFSCPFYKSLLDGMKSHRDAVAPEDTGVNNRIYALCDLAGVVLMQKATVYESKEFPGDPKIPSMYFKRHEDPLYVNCNVYIPEQLKQPTKPSQRGAQTAHPAHNAKRKNVPAKPTSPTNNGTGPAPAGKGRPKRADKEDANDLKRTQDVMSFPIDAMPAPASDSKIRLDCVEDQSDGEGSSEPPSKRARCPVKTE